MTVQKTTSKSVYPGDGNTTEWPITFEVGKEDYIHVYVRKGSEGLTETKNFSFTDTKKDVIYPASGEPLGINDSIVITREIPLKQEMNLVNQGPFFAEDIEKAFDEVTMMIQQVSENVGRALTVEADSKEMPNEVIGEIFNARNLTQEFANQASASASASLQSEENAKTSETLSAQYKANTDENRSSVEQSKLQVDSLLSQVISHEETVLGYMNNSAENARQAKAYEESSRANATTASNASAVATTKAGDASASATAANDSVVAAREQASLASTAADRATTEAEKSKTEADRSAAQVSAVRAEGDAQVLIVQAEGNTQVSRVISEGNTQTVRASSQADRAESAASTAATNAVNNVQSQISQSIAEAQSQANRAKSEADRAADLAAGTVPLPAGAILPFASNGDIPSGFLLCNGASVGKATYPALFDAIGYTYGGSGDYFNLPNLNDNRFIEGSSVAGQYKDAGLPNIEGDVSATESQYKTSFYNVFDKDNGGALYVKNTRNNTYYISRANGSSSNEVDTLVIDASRSNSIYGNSDTVQPKSITVRYIIKAFAGASADSTDLEITKVANDLVTLGGRVNNIASELGATVVDSGKSSDGTIWYRKWSDGWLEQGGTYVGTSAKEQNFNFVSNYADNSIISVLVNVESNWSGNPTFRNSNAYDVTTDGFKIYAGAYIYKWYACGEGATE